MTTNERLPFPGATRETNIRRDARGVWYESDVPLEHGNLTRSFDAWVDRADDGRYCLRNDINWAYVAIEGPPVFVRAAAPGPDGVRLTLSDGRRELLDPDTLREGRDGGLYCDVRGGKLHARFDRSAAQALESLVGEDAEGVYLRVGERRIRPPKVANPDAAPYM